MKNHFDKGGKEVQIMSSAPKHYGKRRKKTG
jgi:hypothetical protein